MKGCVCWYCSIDMATLFDAEKEPYDTWPQKWGLLHWVKKSVASLVHSTLLIASEFRSYPCSWKLTKEIFQTQIHLTCISWELKRRNNKLFLTIMIEWYWPTSPVCFWNLESVDLFVWFLINYNVAFNKTNVMATIIAPIIARILTQNWRRVSMPRGIKTSLCALKNATDTWRSV